MKYSHPAAGSGYSRLKRVFDFSAALILIILSLPIFLLIVVLIRLDSPGPPFFTQARVGQKGRKFTIYKFRTMYASHDSQADVAFLKDFVVGNTSREKEKGKRINKPFQDSAVTRVGAILRRTSLDELPQLINVVKGEMSLVGPRPNLPVEVEAYLPWHRERLEVPPGITGLAQVNGRSELTFDQIARYDIEYVRTANFWLDLTLLFATIRIVFKGEGAA